jgi:hypothetical protein
MNYKKKVLIIHPEGNMYNNPTMKCIIDMLEDLGADISIRYRRSLAYVKENKNIRLFPYNKRHEKIKGYIFDKIMNRYLIQLYVLLMLLKYKNNYDIIIGVDRQGLIEASIISKYTRIPYIYISFEIIFESETNKKFKDIERISSKCVKYWFVQDEIRMRCLINENNLDEINCIKLPLASAGDGVFCKKMLRDDLLIPKNLKLAILMGSINDWTMSKEIIKSVIMWPEEWALIVHSRYGDTERIIKRMIKEYDTYSRKIYISNNSNDMVDDLGYILGGVSLGLTFYKPDYFGMYTGKNLEFLGLSSGKISTFLRYGIPVIMNNIGLYSELANIYNFGFVVNSENEIAKVMDKYEYEEEKYKRNAKEYFKKYLDFNKYKNTVLDAIIS